MNCNWKEFRLGDLTTWASGSTPSKQNPSFWGGEIPWISGTVMRSKNLSDSNLYLTQEGLENKGKLCKKDSILLLVRGDLFKRIPIGIATRSLCFNQDIKAINSVSDNLLKHFIYYLLEGNKKKLSHIVEFTGLGAGKLDTQLLQNLTFKIPPINYQKNLINFIDSIDSKIDLNREINKNLEKIAQAIFKSWFIDFDPVKAKSECLSTGLNNEISDSFPDSFEVSHLGEIPEGWKIHKLGDFIDIKGGLSYESQFIGSGKNLITMGCISPNKKFNFSGLKKYSGDFKESNLLRHKDIVISTRDVTQDRVTLGAPAMVPKILDGSIVATNLYKVIFINKTLSCYFLFESLKSKRYRENIIASAKGSTVLMLTRDSVLDYEIIVPKDDLMKKFHNLYETMQRRYEIINNEIETLVELRDQL